MEPSKSALVRATRAFESVATATRRSIRRLRRGGLIGVASRPLHKHPKNAAKKSAPAWNTSSTGSPGRVVRTSCAATARALAARFCADQRHCSLPWLSRNVYDQVSVDAWARRCRIWGKKAGRSEEHTTELQSLMRN